MANSTYSAEWEIKNYLIKLLTKVLSSFLFSEYVIYMLFHLLNNVFKRGASLILYCGCGIFLGFLLLFFWIIFRTIVLGYGDSGPSWLNTVSNGIFIGSIMFTIVLSQIEFKYIKKNENLWENFKDILLKESINIFIIFKNFHYIIIGYIIGLSIGIFLLFKVWTHFISYDPINGHFGISWEYVLAKWLIGVSVFIGLISIQLIRIKKKEPLAR